MDVTLWAYLVGVQYKIPHPRVVAAEKEKRNRKTSGRKHSFSRYSTRPMRRTAATRRALSVWTNFANSGASM